MTDSEASVVRWLLSHGVPRAIDFLPQLDRARVVSRCCCGCASIDFAIDGMVAPPGDGISVLADFGWKGPRGEMFGVFVFERAGMLAGLEVWSPDGLAPGTSLPDPEFLRPIGTSELV